MFLLVLLLLWNDKEGAHAEQGKQTHCFDMPPLLIVVVDSGASAREARQRSTMGKKNW